MLNLFLILLSCTGFQQAPQKPQTTIHFPEFDVTLLDYEVESDEQAMLLKNKKEVVSIACIPGEIPEGRNIRVIGAAIGGIELKYNYETGIFVTANDVSCDLSYWKHYSAPFVILKQTESNVFFFPELEEKQRQIFIPVNLDELKKEVKSNCGDDFYKQIKNNRSLVQGACEVGIFRYNLKISGTYLKTGKPFSHLIIFEIPMD